MMVSHTDKMSTNNLNKTKYSKNEAQKNIFGLTNIASYCLDLLRIFWTINIEKGRLRSGILGSKQHL